MEINCSATLTTPGGTISFNAIPATEYYFFTDLSGLDQAPLRTSLDPKPHADGAIIHPTLRDARHITLTGFLVATTVTRRNQMEDALRAALESIESVNGSYSWSPTGLSVHNLDAVRCDIPVNFSGNSGPVIKNFQFGLVAVNPAIRLS